MAKKPKRSVQLSGWLPGEQQTGIDTITDEVRSAFEKAYQLGEDTTTPTLTLVVGYLECVGVNHRKNPEDNPPSVAMRFVRLEVVEPGDDHDTTVAILNDIRDKRLGTDALPGIDDDGDTAGDGELGGQPTS